MRGKKMCSAVLLAGVLAISPVFAGRAAAQPSPENVTVSGRVSCTTCLLPNTTKAQTRLSSTLWWVSQGASFVLVADNGQVYRLSGAENDLKKFAGDTVTVSGNLNGSDLAVATVEHATNAKHQER
jgi:Protein of unknown function (DUF5818)